MIKVLIVDDEYLVRKGIRETIDWNAYGFEIVGEAVNGIEGYEQYLKFKPDIIITDIRMKKMDGLQLIRKLRETACFDAEIVILTAFDEFNYVREALDGGAGAYILKPIKEQELITIMQKLKSRLTERRQQHDALESMKSREFLMRDSFIIGLLEGSISDPAQIESQCALFGIHLPENEYTVASIKVDNFETNDLSGTHRALCDVIEYVSNMLDSIRSITCKVADGHTIQLIYYHDDHYKWLQSSTSLLVNYLSAIKEQFEAATGMTLSIGYSMGHMGTAQLHDAYREAKKALSYKKFVGDNVIIDYTSVPSFMSSALVIPNNTVNEILSLIKTGAKEKALEVVNEIFFKMKKIPIADVESIKDVILEMIIVLLRSAFKNVEEINLIYGRTLVPAVELRKLETVDDVEKWTNAVITRMLDANTGHNDSKRVQEIKAIIARDYDQPLTVEQVAEELHISTYYLMHLFKDETGKTFNQCLTEYRIERAKHLMQAFNYKIYEIAELVGYKDATYFSYIFKKHTGMTPKQYAKFTE
ncbi:MAG: response regulator [Firmicutes bacterium]|nr:response regulator [Bacillota bacterium]